ncbi:hypothetical protein NI467_07470 [Acinetobacter bohemicus]|uniref:Uncharacterized protein n=1 Tax=Acinetobacter lwoffii TaxID=28090 RepID=A0A9D2URQ0_ACILW|nr:MULTISPECIES: hypothetical protein [unclassified Acinetobacter]MCO8045184.1 hypothetical protein [Acinetobacter sp. S4397-1]TSH75821.1 hypothetical protein E2K73_06905 [Acinetobacter sp. RF15A]TSI17460.1 hypothetical protein E2K74_08575 [Acinetobacter sp. RF15B]HJF27491.1 hypothetical protein [Acinetobacter lwoffii]
MLKQNICVKDQFGVKYSIQATFNDHASNFHSNIKHITVEGENIRPSLEMLFKSGLSGKIFKILSLT